MSQNIRKITANLPADLLTSAQKVTKKGITLTLIEGLEELSRRDKRSSLRQLRGKVKIQLDLDRTRI